MRIITLGRYLRRERTVTCTHIRQACMRTALPLDCCHCKRDCLHTSFCSYCNSSPEAKQRRAAHTMVGQSALPGSQPCLAMASAAGAADSL